jgi:hypothetical protein
MKHELIVIDVDRETYLKTSKEEIHDAKCLEIGQLPSKTCTFLLWPPGLCAAW